MTITITEGGRCATIGIGLAATGSTPDRQVPQEPIYILLEHKISPSFGFGLPVPEELPAIMQIDYVRLYQVVDDTHPMRLSCNPPDHPTREFIRGHRLEYGVQVEESGNGEHRRRAVRIGRCGHLCVCMRHYNGADWFNGPTEAAKAASSSCAAAEDLESRRAVSTAIASSSSDLDESSSKGPVKRLSFDTTPPGRRPSQSRRPSTSDIYEEHRSKQPTIKERRPRIYRRPPISRHRRYAISRRERRALAIGACCIHGISPQLSYCRKRSLREYASFLGRESSA